MYNFKNQVIAYAGIANKNGAIVSKSELKKIAKKEYVYIAVIDNFNSNKLVGLITEIEYKDSKLMVTGYLTGRNNKRKHFGYGIGCTRSKTLKNGHYTLKNCTLEYVGWIKESQSVFYAEAK